MDEFEHRVTKQIYIFPIVEAPCHLLKVGCQMLCRNAMPRTNDAALKQRECGFHCIRRADQPIFIADIFIRTVVHALVSRLTELRSCEIVEFRVIGHDDIHRLVHVASDDLIQGSLIDLISVDEMQAAIALTNTNHGSLVFKLSFVAALLPADIGLINFNRARKFMLHFGHCGADSMTEVPCGFVRDAKHSLNLICGNTLSGFTDQVCGSEPLWKRKMGVMENGARHYGELIAA